MRSARGSIRGREEGRFVFVVIVVTGCGGGVGILTSGSGREGSGGGSDGAIGTGCTSTDGCSGFCS